jgi:3-methyladenine DNA glycosylase AlkD
MQAYMKSSMPYRGVAMPVVRAQTRHLAAERPFTRTQALRDTALELWRNAEFREERYAATELTGTALARRLQSPDLLGLYREMIVTGAWWDLVDPISQRVGVLLLGWPEQIRPAVQVWTVDEDRWLRRASVICQLKARDQTDVALLTDAIRASVTDRDFFLRKAIGWALRAYAVTDPGWVQDFVHTHENELSPLSKREALRHLK